MDTSGFFDYPGTAAADRPGAGQPEAELALLAGASEAEWDVVISHTETRRFSAGETLLTAGEVDRALYLLTEGQVEPAEGDVAEPIEAPATLGEVAFLDGRPRAITVRAQSGGELLRLSYEAFEALAARDPLLARELALDVGRIVAARLRGAGGASGWTG